MKKDKKKTKIVDVTGISAIGKSTWLEGCNCEKASVYKVIQNELTPNFYYRIFHEQYRLLLFCFFHKNITISNIFWLFRSSMTLRESLKIKLNVFRNCLLKFMIQQDVVNFSRTSSKEIVYIDEGISHIPFLLQNQPKNTQIINEFYTRFSDILSNLNVVCLEAQVDVFSRLKKRGHKRLISASDEEIHEFIKMNNHTLSMIKENSSKFYNFTLLNINA